MLHFRKRTAVFVMAGVISAGAVTGCSGSIDTEAVAATVGDEEITLGVANFYARMTQGQYETYYAGMMGMTGEDMWAQEIEEDKTYEESVKDSIMEDLQDMYIISQHAQEYEVSLSDDEKDAIREAAKEFDELNTAETKEYVSGYRKDIEKYLELATIRVKMEEKMKEGVDEEVSDDEAAQKAMKYVYFSYSSTDESGNAVDLSEDEKASLKTQAQELAERVAAGEDISAVAEEMGQTASDLTFDSESTGPDENLIAAVDAFDTEGACTDPIESENGIYVGQLTSLLDREATDLEKTNIVEERKQEQYDSLLGEWRDATDIEVNKKVWNKVDFGSLGVTIITPEETETTDETSDSE